MGEALDLPACGGDLADDGEGELVGGLVDFKEFPGEGFEQRGLFVEEQGGVAERLGVFAGFEGVLGGAGFARFGFGAASLGAVFTGDLGALFGG